MLAPESVSLMPLAFFDVQLDIQGTDGSNERHQKVEKGIADAKIENVLKKRSGIDLRTLV